MCCFSSETRHETYQVESKMAASVFSSACLHASDILYGTFWSVSIGPVHVLVTWYGINNAWTQITQWDFRNKGKNCWTGTSSIVLEVPLRSQHNLFRTMGTDRAKRLLHVKIKPLKELNSGCGSSFINPTLEWTESVRYYAFECNPKRYHRHLYHKWPYRKTANVVNWYSIMNN